MRAQGLFKYLQGSWRVHAHSKIGYSYGKANFKLKEPGTLSYKSTMKIRSDYQVVELGISYKYLLNDNGLFLSFSDKSLVPVCFESYGIFSHYNKGGYYNEMLWTIHNNDQFDLMCSAQGHGLNETSLTNFNRMDAPEVLGSDGFILKEESD